MTDSRVFTDLVMAAIAAVKVGDRDRLAALLATAPALAHARSADGRSLLGHLTDYPANIAAGPALVQALIAAGAAVDDLALATDLGETPLQWAVSANDCAVGETLLAAGAVVDGPTGNGRPLAQALFYGQRAAAELLVRHGARITLETAAGLGRLDLVAACFDDDGHVVPAAGEHCPPVNRFVPLESSDPQAELLEQALVYAAINGQVVVVDELLRRGADGNVLPSGFDIRLTPLHWAVVRGQAESVAALIAAGLDLAVRDPHYQATPLSWATYHRQEAIADLLRRAKAPA